MRFSDIIGHKEVITTLRDMVDNDRIPHAILLGGIPGIGKMRMARAFIQYSACTDRHDGEPCGKCPACRQIESFNFPDIYYVFPIVKRSGTKSGVSADFATLWGQFLNEKPYMPFEAWMEALDAGNSQPAIHVTESGEIVRRLNLSAYSSKYKVVVIWLPEKMNTEAANKLLKIIEEPYSDTLFVMVSNEPDKILPTILSRTRRIAMRPLPADVIAARLQQDLGIDAETATALARLSAGSYGKALQDSGQSAEPTEFRSIFQEMMRMAYTRNAPRLKELSEDIAAMGRDKSRRFLAYAATMLRENFIFNLHNPELNFLTADEQSFSSRFSPFVNAANIDAMSAAVSSASADIERNANAKIVCFDLMLKIMLEIRKK